MRNLVSVFFVGSLVVGCGPVNVGFHDAGPSRDASTPCGPTACPASFVCCDERCGVCAAPGGRCPPIGCEGPVCDTDFDCRDGTYCARPFGQCAGPGRCEPLAMLDCSADFAPVCGCNGQTYENDCIATRRGANLAWVGPCDRCLPQDVVADASCARELGVYFNGAYCERLIGCRCEGSGCDALFGSIEECESAYAGCPSRCDPDDATGVGACDRLFGFRWNGRFCETISGCDCIGEDCSALADAPEICLEVHAMCTPDDEGCVVSAECAPNLFCYSEPGICAAGPRGRCVPLPAPLDCPPEGPAVCGCDGLTYPCERAVYAAGMSIAHEGGCGEAACPPMDVSPAGTCPPRLLGFAWNGERCSAFEACDCRGADCSALHPSLDACWRSLDACPRRGPCGGPERVPCRSGEFCQLFEPHACEEGAFGECQNRPTRCPTTLEPVCGCDGATYDNACSAALAGVGSYPLEPGNACRFSG